MFTNEFSNNFIRLDSTFMKEETNQLTALVKEMKEKMDTLEENIKIAQDSDLDVLDIAMMWRDDVLSSYDD